MTHAPELGGVGFLFRDMSPAEKRIRDRIELHGPISFEEFMDIALYDPECGYYVRGPEIGLRGDFHTIAHIDSLFGEILADCFVRWMNPEGGPASGFDVLELGAGTGRLAADILFAVSTNFPELRSHVRYLIDEISPGLRRWQAQALASYSGVAWERLESVATGSLRGIMFSNELFDALPCRRMVRKDGRWLELNVGITDDRLTWVETEISHDHSAGELSASGFAVRSGDAVEWPLRAKPLLDLIASRMASGYLLIIDYGAERTDLWSHSGPNGTVRCFHQHQLHDDPLVHIGDQDITYSVDFTLLREAGEAAGFETVSYGTLEGFLRRERVLDRVARLIRSSERIPGSSRSLSLKHLVVPSALTEKYKV